MSVGPHNQVKPTRAVPDPATDVAPTLAIHADPLDDGWVRIYDEAALFGPETYHIDGRAWRAVVLDHAIANSGVPRSMILREAERAEMVAWARRERARRAA